MGLDLSGAVGWLRESMAKIPELAEAIRANDVGKTAACYGRAAEAETKAFAELSKTVDLATLR